MIAAWLPLALLAYFMLAANGTIDRIIVHKEVTKPVVVSFWVAVFSVPTIAILLVGLLPVPFADEFTYVAPNASQLLKIIASGFMVQAALLFMYKALHDSEATRVLSAMGAIVPIVTLVASYFLLNERLGRLSALAVVVLILGTVTLTLKTTKKTRRLGSQWIVNTILASFVFALQSVIIKQVYDEFHFISAFALMSLGALLYLMVLVLASRHVRELVIPHGHGAPKAKKDTKSQVVLIFINSMLGGVAVIILNAAIAQGSPTLVNSLRGVQYAAIFVIAVMLANKHPHLLDEELSKRSVIQKISGIMLVTIGVAILAAAT